ncbi:MAG: patatin-like phospholipase family protein [Capnocytophaga sp.]|nr:patatin-like phospholipase family protein [Capnocytophaga sp.]
MKNIGFVLSGGGIRALAHAGLLQALSEENIKPSILSGTSGGALVGGLYACGVPPKEMFHFFKKTPVFKFSLVAFGKPGVVDSAKYPELFEKFFPYKTFEELQIPLTVTATNLLTGKLTYFDSGELIKPLTASAALPPYFSPVKINKTLYCDGGLLNNFPVEPLKGKCDAVIGSFVNPLEEVDEKGINNILKFTQRIYSIAMDAAYYNKFKRCNYVFLPPDIHKINVLDVRMVSKAYEIGYQHAKAEMDMILSKIEQA